METIKKIVRRILARLGFQLKRINPRTNPTFQLQTGLSHFNVSVVFDVGANAGQFASELRDMGFLGRIVSFEPLTDAHSLLSRKAEKDALWTVHKRSAVGAETGSTVLNVAGNSVSSSVLPMLAAHSDAASGSAYIGTETVPILRLDDVAETYLKSEDRNFVKIDTQGYEWQVIDGAEEILEKATGVLCELSMVPLYEGQRLWRDVVERLENKGFTLWAIQKGFTDPRDGRTLQVDAIFFRVDDRKVD